MLATSLLEHNIYSFGRATHIVWCDCRAELCANASHNYVCILIVLPRLGHCCYTFVCVFMKCCINCVAIGSLHFEQPIYCVYDDRIWFVHIEVLASCDGKLNYCTFNRILFTIFGSRCRNEKFIEYFQFRHSWLICKILFNVCYYWYMLFGKLFTIGIDRTLSCFSSFDTINIPVRGCSPKTSPSLRLIEDISRNLVT